MRTRVTLSELLLVSCRPTHNYIKEHYQEGLRKLVRTFAVDGDDGGCNLGFQNDGVNIQNPAMDLASRLADGPLRDACKALNDVYWSVASEYLTGDRFVAVLDKYKIDDTIDP